MPTGSVTVDGHGYLTDPTLWTPEFAEHVARAENIILTAEHLFIIEYIRFSEIDKGVTPDARFVFKLLANKFNLSKSGSKAAFFELFPYGYVKQACKIAGMKQPRAWSTG
ncbi:MAG: TusE/DsrC/DsvC family sulfur relay protein [Paracoccaceae bacterium]